MARLAEVRELLRLRDDDAAQSEGAAPWLLLGDLNSLSADDAAHYAEEAGSGGADGGA